MVWPKAPFCPFTEDTLITRPQARSTMPSITCLVMLKQESRLVRITASQSDLDIFLNVMSRVMPALFTRMSIGPHSDWMRWQARTQSSKSTTSTGYAEKE
ncbi:hypothetical protein D3C83_17140 [compost metagenome]